MSLPAVEIRYCIACGCNEFAACETESGPCGWAVVAGDRGICTRCKPHFAAPQKTLGAIMALLREGDKAVRKR